jgi:hypothetical protein
LHIHSELPLAGLAPRETEREPDVFVRLRAIERRPAAGEPRTGCFHATAYEAYLFWEEDGVYLVRGGREIVVDPAPGANERLLSLVILGMAMGILLHQRGGLTLHGSAVAVDGAALAFLGAKGAGKSAIAAALEARGHQLVADDVVVLDVQAAGDPLVLPGVPQLKLWPDVAAFLGHEPDMMPRIHPQLQKRACLAGQELPQVPLRLQAIYILADGPHAQIEMLQGQESFLEMIRHSYALRFLGTAGLTAAQFQQCARLAGSTPVRRLSRPPSLAALPDVARLVEQTAACDPQQAER